MLIFKQTPDDFRVEELTDVQPGDGPFALYRLDKRDWTTPDALVAVRRRWKINRRRLSFGGLKDRHAHTTQHFTIFRGPARKLTHQGFSVAYLGQTDAPFTSDCIVANRFDLVLRGLTPDEMTAAKAALAEVKDFGMPNYFDDQRFGSVTKGSPFFARHLVLGQFEEALRLALTAPYEHDRGPQKKEKAILRAGWGDWSACLLRLRPGDARRVVQHLADHPEDFAGAIERLRPELRTLYLSAYQSHLWNRMLAAWLRAHLSGDELIMASLRLGDVPMHRRLVEGQLELFSGLMLPLASPKAVLAEDDPRKPFLDAVLAEEGITLDHFRLKELRDVFFSRGERAALCIPRDLSWETGIDDVHAPLAEREEYTRHAGSLSLRLHFTLPRGSYATLLVKRLG